ncbi:MAG: tripartite tricarboxylate transporter TctB family protein [Proteobacteria bacterium]|nr:tripartite tricarboxylate transporter TctB family protein [Pseudomonadota bacterium]
MTHNVEEAAGSGPSHRGMEIGVAVLMAVIAIIGVIGSLQVGIGWAAEGPRAGFFPFYISVIVLISCAVNIVTTLRHADDGATFATWGQLAKVMQVLVPTSIYAVVVPYIGIYVASALLIALFMRWFGRYNWLIVAAVAVGLPIVTFVTFEIWFLVPLPKGPLEAALGF